MKKFILSVLFLVSASLAAAPQAVVFDYGGVMTGAPNRQAVIEFLCVSLKLTPAQFEKANQEKHQQIKSGKTDEQFWMEFAEKNGIPLPAEWAQNFKSVMKEALGVNPEMYTLVAQLKEQQIQVALLSNIDERLSKLIREFELYEPFHPCLLSWEIGAAKPDSRAYEILMERLGLPSTDIVFIDDMPENVAEAQRMGIDAILFKSSEQIRFELMKRELL